MLGRAGYRDCGLLAGALALLGSERPEEVVGSKLRDRMALGFGAQRRPPFILTLHSPGSSPGDQEDSQEGSNREVRSARYY